MKSQPITINSQYKFTDSAKFPIRAVENLLIIAKQSKILEKEIIILRQDNSNYQKAEDKCDSIISLKNAVLLNNVKIIEGHRQKDIYNEQIKASQEKSIKSLTKSLKKQNILKKGAATIGLVLLGIIILK